MSSSNKVSQRESQILTLIEKEYQLLLKGKNPTKIIEILESYELDPLCKKISPETFQKMIVCYIISGEYLRLVGLLQRHPTEANLLVDLVQASVEGNRENLVKYAHFMTRFISAYASNQSKVELKKLLEQSVLKFILRTYSKYYINISFAQVNELTKCSKQNVTELGYFFDGDFITLKDESVSRHEKYVNDTLMNKMREIALIAHSMTSYQ